MGAAGWATAPAGVGVVLMPPQCPVLLHSSNRCLPGAALCQSKNACCMRPERGQDAVTMSRSASVCRCLLRRLQGRGLGETGCRSPQEGRTQGVLGERRFPREDTSAVS